MSGQSNSAMTSTSFLKALSNGDTAAWKIACVYYWGMSYMWARRSGCRDQEAEDIAQTAMLKIYQHAGSFDHPGIPFAFRGWLKTIVMNLVKDTFRDRLDPVGTGDTTFLEGGGVAVAYTEQLLDEQLVTAISQAVAKMAGMRDESIKDYLLKTLSDKSVGELAESTQSTMSAIYQRVYRASKSLPEKLTKLDVESIKQELIVLLRSAMELEEDAEGDGAAQS